MESKCASWMTMVIRRADKLKREAVASKGLDFDIGLKHRGSSLVKILCTEH